jgi:hypothetical protein
MNKWNTVDFCFYFFSSEDNIGIEHGYEWAFARSYFAFLKSTAVRYRVLMCDDAQKQQQHHHHV